MPNQTAQSSLIEKEREQHFLLASQFEIAAPRRFPRVRRSAAHAWSRLAGHVGDLMFERGIETAGHMHDVAHFHPDRVWYQASGWTCLRRVLPRREVGPDDVLVDLGSGKGRVLRRPHTDTGSRG